MTGQTNARPPEKRRSMEVVRLLRSALGHPLLGERLSMDLYARIGFRLLAVPAWLDPTTLAMRRQQFSNIVRLSPARAREHAIHTIPDEHLDTETLLAAVDKLESPRHRFVAELFWPHLEGAEFDVVQRANRLGSLEVLKSVRSDGRKGLARATALHARALAHHCLAIEAELDFLEGQSDPPVSQWTEAILCWRELVGLDEFWRYMGGRAAKIDDPRVKMEDVEKARQEIPRVILGVQELLAERYADRGNYQECARQLDIIRQSGFSETIVRTATWNAVKRVADVKLDELCRRAKETFDAIKENANRDRISVIAEPLVREAQEMRDILVERLRLSDALLEQSAFDRFAETVRDAVAVKLKYDSPERERNITL